MGVLYDLKMQVETIAVRQHRDVSLIRGEISRKAGFMISLVGVSSPDDPDRVARLKDAIFEVLNEQV